MYNTEMSNIEKALEKFRREKAKGNVKVSSPKHTDSSQADSGVKNKLDHSSSRKTTDSDKNAFVLDYHNMSNPESSSESKSDKNDSYIMSAIERQKVESDPEHHLSTGDDENKLVTEDKYNIPQKQDTKSDDPEIDKVIPVTRMDNYDVEEHIVSYYDSIGRQTWKGPVMVHFRRLQVSLNNMQRDNMCKVSVFTSATQNEGKSTIALNTAITLCSDKKSKIAIVDCDFRKPTINKLLGFSSDKGLSDYLAKKVELKEIFIDGLVPGLTIIPAGNKPSNTCELFASDRMKDFISYLREQFDYAIIDTPPVLAFPDTVILSPLSDGVVFVINCKSVRKTAVKRAVDILHDSKIMGFIMNKSEASAVDYYGYTSGYYYYDQASS